MQLWCALFFFSAGIALDWAFYSRLVAILGMQHIQGFSDGYLTFLFPRVLLTVAAITIVFLGGTATSVNVVGVLCGSGMFVASNLYAVYRFYRGDDITR